MQLAGEMPAVHELHTGRAIAAAQGGHGQTGADGIGGGHAEVLVDELVGTEGHEPVELRAGAVELVPEAAAGREHAEHAEVAGAAHETRRDPVAPLVADRAAHLEEADHMRVARQDAVEVAVLRVVRLEAALVADAGLHQPDIGKAAPPAELHPLPEEQVVPFPVVHRPSRLDLELGLIRTVVGVLVFDADTERHAPTVAVREVEDRREGHEGLRGRLGGERGGRDQERTHGHQGAQTGCVDPIHPRVSPSTSTWWRTVRRGYRRSRRMEGDGMPPVDCAPRAVFARHERRVSYTSGALETPPRCQMGSQG